LPIDRFCALCSLCWPSLAGDTAEERFLNAAKAAARLVGHRLVWRQDATIRSTANDTAG
jgi:hypothetical protein